MGGGCWSVAWPWCGCRLWHPPHPQILDGTMGIKKNLKYAAPNPNPQLWRQRFCVHWSIKKQLLKTNQALSVESSRYRIELILGGRQPFHCRTCRHNQVYSLYVQTNATKHLSKWLAGRYWPGLKQLTSTGEGREVTEMNLGQCWHHSNHLDLQHTYADGIDCVSYQVFNLLYTFIRSNIYSEIYISNHFEILLVPKAW